MSESPMSESPVSESPVSESPVNESPENESKANGSSKDKPMALRDHLSELRKRIIRIIKKERLIHISKNRNLIIFIYV